MSQELVEKKESQAVDFLRTFHEKAFIIENEETKTIMLDTHEMVSGFQIENMESRYRYKVSFIHSYIYKRKHGVSITFTQMPEKVIYAKWDESK